MGNRESRGNDCYITKSGEHVSCGEIIEAGAAQARLDDLDSASPIADNLYILLNQPNWHATPDNIQGPCDEH